jgi:hypothetical protein
MIGWLKRKLTKPKPAPDRQRALRGIPVILPGITSEEREGERMVYIPRQAYARGLMRKLLKAPPPEPGRVLLDDLGNTVWDLIDGKRTVKEIAERFAREKQLHPREAEASVIAFLQMLMKRNIIGIMMK